MDCTKDVIALTLFLCTGRPRHHTNIASVDVRDITAIPVPWTSETSQGHQCSGRQRHHTDIPTTTRADVATASPIVQSPTSTTLISKHEVGEIPTTSRVHYKNTLGRIVIQRLNSNMHDMEKRHGSSKHHQQPKLHVTHSKSTSLTANQRHSQHRYADFVAHTNGVLLKCIHDLLAMAVNKGTLNPNTLTYLVPVSTT